MTGWQGNEGGYPGGGWNPQQDPYGGQNAGGQYGGAPGQPGQWGQDPYGGAPGQYPTDPYQGQYGPGQTSAYPAYQTGYGFPPEPPKRSKLPIILSVIAIVAVVGAVVTIVVLNRNDEPSPTAGGGATSSRPAPRSAPPSSRRLPTSSRKPTAKPGWTEIRTPLDDTYLTPPGWQADPRPQDSGLGVNFIRGALVGPYDCGGSNYFRGFTAAGEVQSKSGADLDLNKTVTDFATSFANTYYRSPKLETPAPTETTVDGKKGATLTVKLTVTPAKPECDATSGEVAILGVPVERGGKATIRMLVVVNDLAGGPATPPGLPDPLAEEILAGFKLG
ncbi:hypothetical protein [Actinophytocola sp.]|uniref:hypothetical protein n=1 Tax=Actinophytocola sp. TaxID=1872138 RepID=UPI002D7E2473|nr:hypothetical protein [Actinophytocola sp.]HET9142101.1 hypothetical protein [Actinophytocola sp.]